MRRKCSSAGSGIAAPQPLAFDQRICAVEFDQAFRGGAGEAMQTVNVLGDHGAEFSGFFQTDDGVMNGVGPGVAKRVSPFQLVIPMLDSRRFRRHEILIVDRLPPGPDTLRPAEIRDAAVRRDAGAGEDQRLLRGSEIVGESHCPIIGSAR